MRVNKACRRYNLDVLGHHVVVVGGMYMYLPYQTTWAHCRGNTLASQHH